MKMTEIISPQRQDDSPPISLSRFNIKPIPPRVQNTIFGKVRAFNTFTKSEWIYLAIALLALTASLGITIQKLFTLQPSESDFTFAILLILTTVFCYHYVIHSIFTERWDELMVFVVSNIIVWVYCIVNYIDGEKDTTKMVRLILVSCFSPFLIFVGIVQSVRYCRSNNLIFNAVGGISSLQESCRLFYICSSLLKFDLQLQLSMLILVMGKGVLDMSYSQKIILASGVPVTFLFIIIGNLGMRYEKKSLMIIFYLLSLCEPAYVIYKLYYTINYEKDVDATYNATFICGYFTLVIWVLLIISTAYFVKCHFGKGLKEKMLETSEAAKRNFSTSSVMNTATTDVDSPSGSGNS